MLEHFITQGQIAEFAKKQAELAQLINNYPCIHKAGGPVEDGVFIQRNFGRSRIDVFSDRPLLPYSVDGFGKGGISLKNNTAGGCLSRLVVRLHTDSCTEEAVAELLEKMPGLAQGLSTTFIFDPSGSSLKIATLPVVIEDPRPPLAQLGGYKYVESEIEPDDLPMIQTAHQLLAEILTSHPRVDYQHLTLAVG